MDETKYVVGFAHDGNYMAFVKKNRPEWQAGLLNGVGGHVEEHETDSNAMQREFWEETGVAWSDWRRLVTMTYPGQARIVFYTARMPSHVLNSVRSATDEAVEVHSIEYVGLYPHLFIPNLAWLVPLAIADEKYLDFQVIGVPAQAAVLSRETT